MAYNPNIPQGGDNLSVSQSDMLENFTQLNNKFDIDHYAFDDVTDAGKHRKVLFPAVATDPVLSNPAGQLYTKQVNSITQLFFANASGTSQLTSVGGNVSANSGSVQLGSILIKWGKVSVTFNVNSNTRGTLTFPTGGGLPAFSGTPYSVVAWYDLSAANVNNIVDSSTPASSTTATVTHTISSPGPYDVYFIAIGPA